VLQLVFATVAGAGALVALTVAYRREKITEADSVHDRTRLFNERFTAIAAQLGDAQPAVRLAGVHAMAGLADDWKQNRQTCVDVLCAYLRLPYDPDPGDSADPTERTAYRANREVRHTIIRLIGAHLRAGAAVSWQGLNFDFTGVVFDGGDFSSARFSGGTVSFADAEFASDAVSFIGAEFCGGRVYFSRANFSGGAVDFGLAVFSGGVVGFFGAGFSGGRVNFYRANFSGGEVIFFDAGFSGGQVDFSRAGFSGGAVTFDRAGFSGGAVGFMGAGFSGGTVYFRGAVCSGGEVDFGGAVFSGGDVSFYRAEFSGGKVSFNRAEFSGGRVSFNRAEFSGGQVDFSSARRWSSPPMFSWDGEPPTGVVLPVQPSEETRDELSEADERPPGNDTRGKPGTSQDHSQSTCCAGTAGSRFSG
jgi:uncharacterized protein YjbI with pentapeptide repeats